MMLILVFMNAENFCHSTYERACAATDYFKEISMSMIEEFVSKLNKLDFEDIRYCLADFKSSERRAADFEDTVNITVNSVSLLP